ncbi:MAG: GAF domain-containing SpoIIE family protein phosphatase [Planctomycetota bacterium]
MSNRLRTITDFLTDASLAALCDALTSMTGVRVELRTAEGQRISRSVAIPPWTVHEADGASEDVRCTIALLNGRAAGTPTGKGPLVEPITVDGVAIGALTIERDKRGTQLHESVRLLAHAVNELCQHEVELEHRHAELGVLFALSSLLVATNDTSEILGLALGSAVEVLRADAGTVHLVDEDARELRLHAQRGVSDSFVENFEVLPLGKTVDRRALVGEVVKIEDLHRDGQALMLDELAREGLVGMVSTGLTFRGRPIGVMRLYTKQPIELDTGEQALLQTIGELASASIVSAQLLESERAHRRTQRQLALEGDVQRRMLPEPPEVPGFDIAARWIPSFELGGDLFDFIELGGSVGVAIGDVVGKGVPAALLMASARAFLRAHAQDVYHVHEVVGRANANLTRETLSSEFVTLFYGVLDPASGRFTYCNAGHEAPIVLRANGELEELHAGGTVLGIDMTHEYESGVCELGAGDILLAYTDGLVEAADFNGELFGRQRLREAWQVIVRTHPGADARQLIDQLVWKVRTFTGLAPGSDDLTLVVVKRGVVE